MDQRVRVDHPAGAARRDPRPVRRAARGHPRGPRHLRRPDASSSTRGRGGDDRRGAGPRSHARCSPPWRPTARSPTSTARSTSSSPTSCEDLALPGIGFLEVPKRYYPAGALAPQVLGFVNVDGEGAAGLEGAYDETARRHAGGADDRALGRRPRDLERARPPGAARSPARRMHTTLDRQMQYMVQAALERAVKANERARRHGRRDGPGNGRGARDGHLSVVRPQRLQRGAARRDAQPRRHRRVRAGLGEQDHHRGRGDRDGRGLARRALPGAGLAWRSVRSRSSDSPPAPGRVDDDRRHHHGVEQHRRRPDRRAGGKRARSRTSCSGSATAGRPGSGSPGRHRARMLAGRRLGRGDPRDRLVRPGHLGDAAADGERLRDDRERRPVDAADARAGLRGPGRRVRPAASTTDAPGHPARHRPAAHAACSPPRWKRAPA